MNITQQTAPIAPTTTPATGGATADMPLTDMFSSSTPLHTQTQSTLAPTAEFTRIFLLAWIIRYIFRGASGTLFEEAQKTPGIRNAIINALSAPGRALKNSFFPKVSLTQMEAATYAGAIGVGSGWLSYRYSRMVKSDIQNIFSEAVAYEKDKPVSAITFDDIKESDNHIVQRTVENHRSKLRSRLGTDAMFFGAAVLRSAHITDFLLGIKGLQIFSDTWKRKTTMFEDLITFINNKINPRNGLGQAITVGEIFDLYQHYSEMFAPTKMFHNVLERSTEEGARWAQSQPIFQRITELMNLTYAYKHSSVIDPTTGRAVPQADFALPKFIYLLGHDLIDVNQPQQTLVTIEIANRFGIGAVKEMQVMLKNGGTLEDIVQRFPVPLAPQSDKKKEVDDKNGVIAKGSTMQLDQADMPQTKIDTDSILGHTTLAPQVSVDRTPIQ